MTVTGNILVIDSDFEGATRAGRNYRDQNVYPYLSGRGFKVIRCQGNLAKRVHVFAEVMKPGIVLVSGLGHGDARTFTGQGLDPIFEMGNYTSSEVNGKIIHLLSCKTAIELGSDMVAQGARAFFGYNEDFIFYFRRADVFFECDSEIDKLIANGEQAGNVYHKAIALFEERIDDLVEMGDDAAANALLDDRNSLCGPGLHSMYGDPTAKVEINTGDKPHITEVEQDIRRGFRVKVDRILHRSYRWQPYLEIQLSIEEVRHVPLRVVGAELFLSYNSEDVGPLPALPRPYKLQELGEGIKIIMRKDLYPTLDTELSQKKGTEQYFQIRGQIVVDSPNHEGTLETLVDISHEVKL